MAIRIAYDGIAADAAAISAVIAPHEMCFYYADGYYAWSHDEVQAVKEKGAHVLAITVVGSPHCSIYDGPPDNGNVRNWAAYIRACHKLQLVWPTIYTDRNLLPELERRCAGLDYSIIVADPGVSADTIIPGTVGTQYFWGGKYDLTAIHDDTWHPYDR